MFVGGLAMFISMISGELLVRGDLFGGLTHQPAVWPWIFIESAVWLLPFSILGLSILIQIQKRIRGPIVLKAGTVWIGAGLAIVFLYKLFYFPHDWRAAQRFPEIAFGWLIPCCVILAGFVLLSVKHFDQKT